MEAENVWRQTDRLHAKTGKGDPFAAAVRATRMPMIITDPRQFDNPIVFANDAFLALTGYDREDLIGRNCRFLQGPGTDRSAAHKIRHAVETLSDINVEILNYRKNGTSFWNALYISPVIDEEGDLLFFFASQLDVTTRKEAEFQVEAARDHFEQMFEERSQVLKGVVRDLQDSNKKLEQALETQTTLLHEVDHRVKNNLQMVASLVLLQSRTIPDEAIKQSLMEMLSRIEALGTVHRRLYQSDDVTTFDLGECVRDLVTDLTGVNTLGKVKPAFDLAHVLVPAEDGAPLALIVNELVTNALKHAFPLDRAGTITVKVGRLTDRLRVEIADDGIGENVDGKSRTSFGTSLIHTLARQLKAKVTWTNNSPGTRVTIDIPIR